MSAPQHAGLLIANAQLTTGRFIPLVITSLSFSAGARCFPLSWGQQAARSGAAQLLLPQ